MTLCSVYVYVTSRHAETCDTQLDATRETARAIGELMKTSLAFRPDLIDVDFLPAAAACGVELKTESGRL